MHPKNFKPTSLALFCKVVDNFGDIGICWRLARQLEQEHGIAVTLWVDDLLSFQRICQEVVVASDTQRIDSVTVRHWCDQNGLFGPEDVADIVIEFFACDLPPAYISAMAQRNPAPVWINLEGLSAETWVEGCHTLSSPPSQSLTKYFFFPGFNEKTGGLLREIGLQQQRETFQDDKAEIQAFLAQFGVTLAESYTLKISLFCYPHAPVAALLEVWQSAETAIVCLIPEGVAVEAVKAFLGRAPIVGATATRGALTVRVLPFMSQPNYDKLLWACDVNFVRGEDSFVRAQWAGKPFIWHIYPQDKDLHLVKLNAFLACHTAKTEHSVAFSVGWNAAANDAHEWLINLTKEWTLLAEDFPKIANISTEWEIEMMKNGDFTSNLVKFAETVR